jgi:hypothetical protein
LTCFNANNPKLAQIAGFIRISQNAKTPNLYKKWGFKIQLWHSPQGLPLVLMGLIDISVSELGF